MGKKISLDELSVELKKELKEYSQKIADQIKEGASKVAKECCEEIRDTSPIKTGAYKKGWKAKVVYENQENIRIVVHNAAKPELTQLLENGHAKVNGGRVEGTPHIGPAEERAKQRFLRKVEEAVKG